MMKRKSIRTVMMAGARRVLNDSARELNDLYEDHEAYDRSNIELIVRDLRAVIEVLEGAFNLGTKKKPTEQYTIRIAKESKDPAVGYFDFRSPEQRAAIACDECMNDHTDGEPCDGPWDKLEKNTIEEEEE